MRGGVVGDVDRFIAGQSRLDVEQRAVFGMLVDARIADDSDRAVRVAVWTMRWADANASREIDRDPEIDSDFADRIAQILERVVAIARRIGDDDEPAAPRDHFVQSEIFEMPAIGQIHVRIPVGRPAEHLAD